MSIEPEIDLHGQQLLIRPVTLPFPPTEENNVTLKEWLLNAFHSSCFNTTDHMPHLAKPMNMHPNDDAIPYAVFAPIPTPPHWRDTVTDQLMDDIDSKVLRKVPVGEANEWCARMVIEEEERWPAMQNY